MGCSPEGIFDIEGIQVQYENLGLHSVDLKEFLKMAAQCRNTYEINPLNPELNPI